MIAPGSYMLGFLFVIPKEVPSSIFFKKDRNKSKVKYTLKAYFAGSKTKIVSKQILMIRAPPVVFQGGAQQASKTKMANCCCISKGTATANVEFEKNIYCPNEVAKCIVHVDNTLGEVECTSVALNITQHTTMRIKSFNYSNTSVLASSAKKGPLAHQTADELIEVDLSRIRNELPA
jgi:hypothetical protein